MIFNHEILVRKDIKTSLSIHFIFNSQPKLTPNYIYYKKSLGNERQLENFVNDNLVFLKTNSGGLFLSFVSINVHVSIFF